MYSLYLYFLGLSFRNTSKALYLFKDRKRSYACLYGIGFKDSVHTISTNEKEYLHLS